MWLWWLLTVVGFEHSEADYYVVAVCNGNSFAYSCYEK